jgi:hypothetical protein
MSRQPTPAARRALAAVARTLSPLDDPLEQLIACRKLSGLLDELARSYANDAARHHTWQQIGDALGISRQSAWMQYRPQTPHHAKSTTSRS